MPFYIYAWIATTTSAFEALTGKLTSKYAVKNPWFYNFLWTFITLVFTIPLSLFNHAGFPKDIGFIIGASFCSALWYVFFTLALYRLDLTVLTPLFNFRTIFVIILSWVFLKEILVPSQFIWVMLIIIGGFLVSLDEKLDIKSFFKLSVLFAVIAMFFLALNNVFIKKVMVSNDLWTATLWMGIFTQIILLPTIPLFSKEIKKIKPRQISPLILISIFGVVSNFAGNLAYKTNVTITAIIFALPISMILAFILSVVKPDLLEKHTLKIYLIRFGAAAIMIFSALKLTM